MDKHQLKALREYEGLTMKEMFTRIKVSRGHYSNYESGSREIPLKKALEIRLAVSELEPREMTKDQLLDIFQDFL